MKNHRAAQSTEPFPATAPLAGEPEPGKVLRAGERNGLPEGWQELSTALPGSKLYRIAPRAGADAEWQAEMTVNRRVLRRRCATELRARAWLAIWDKPTFALRELDTEELNGSLRASFFQGE